MITPQSKIQKGRLLENFIAQEIRRKMLDPLAMRQLGSGASKWKGDINTKMRIINRQVVIECKNQTRITLPEWWRQTDRQAYPSCEPVLVIKFPQEPLEAAKAEIYFKTLLNLIELAQLAKKQLR